MLLQTKLLKTPTVSRHSLWRPSNHHGSGGGRRRRNSRRLLRPTFLTPGPTLPSRSSSASHPTPALSAPPWPAAASSPPYASPAFRRRFRELHPPPLLGFFFESNGTDIPSFTPVRRRHDPYLAAAVRGADVFLTRLPYHDDACTGWEVAECRGGCLLLLNCSTDQIAVYNPLTRALDLLPMLPDEISDGRRGKFDYMDFFLLSSEEAPGSSRVVSVGHD